MGELHAIHPSMRGLRRTPNRMSALRMPNELHAAATQIALDIFTDCTNNGLPLQDALLAIYVSGLEHGKSITEENAA